MVPLFMYECRAARLQRNEYTKGCIRVCHIYHINYITIKTIWKTENRFDFTHTPVHPYRSPQNVNISTVICSVERATIK